MRRSNLPCANAASSFTEAIDNVVLEPASPVPEPASLALLGAACSASAWPGLGAARGIER